MGDKMSLKWDHEKILYEKDSHVAIITKNRPDKLNAMDQEMMDAYYEAIEDAENDDDVRVIVITGIGKGWHPGADPEMFRKGTASMKKGNLPAWTKPPASNPQLNAIRNSGKIFIAAVNGYAYGAGFGDALWCDLRIIAQSAKLGPVWAKFAAPLENATSATLTTIVGPAKALELYLLREPIEANYALELGLANWVVPDDELMDFTLSMAKKIAQNSPYGTALSKWMIYKQATPNADEHVELYRIAESITSLTEDSKEGGTAFREKRDPDFKGM
jgi:enoyl-CoA hydratase/carnithine racemase